MIAANGTIEIDEEARVHVIDLHMFVTVQLLGDTPCDNSGKQNTATITGIPGKTSHHMPIVVQGLPSEAKQFQRVVTR